jgi:hypothetical protein
MGLASVALFAAPSSKKAGAKLGEGTYKLIHFLLLSGVKALPGVDSSSPTISDYGAPRWRATSRNCAGPTAARAAAVSSTHECP